jgi:hypothetical protein
MKDEATNPDAHEPGQLPRFVFGVSGHRDLVPENLEELRAQIRIVFDRFRLAYPNPGYDLLSPLAEGADRAAAEVALNCGIKLIVPLPMAQPEYEQDFVTTESVTEFRQLLTRAASYFEVCEKGSEKSDRPEKYAAVGDYIARRSNVLILLWDGRDNDKIGGTSWVRKRREHWIARSKSGESPPPPPFGYAGTIHIRIPRLANPEPSGARIMGDLPALSTDQADVRSRL